MQKTVQISTALFIRLIDYFDYNDPESYEAKELRKKLLTLCAHEQYSNYRTARTDEERAESLAEYLNILREKNAGAGR